jgi:hypothetical protein
VKDNNKQENKMKVKELIKKLQECDQELEVNTYEMDSSNPTNYWVTSVEEVPTGMSGYEDEGEVLLITSE